LRFLKPPADSSSNSDDVHTVCAAHVRSVVVVKAFTSYWVFVQIACDAQMRSELAEGSVVSYCVPVHCVTALQPMPLLASCQKPVAHVAQVARPPTAA
jgi:hypothetical protein